MEQYEKFKESVKFRLFSKELADILRIIRYTKTKEGAKKYDNLSHFIRCAVIKLINEEKLTLQSVRGRPKKH